ncbi:MAG: DEAD/DEAH box helicase [Phycisphaerales bacterium JB037]
MTDSDRPETPDTTSDPSGHEASSEPRGAERETAEAGPDEGADESKPKKKRKRKRKRKSRDGEREKAEAKAGGADSAEGDAGEARGGDESGDGPGEDRSEDRGEGGKKKRKRKRKRKPRDGEREEAEAIGEESDEDVPVRARPVPVEPDDPDLFDLERTFADLGLNEDIVRGLDAAGFRRPTVIQAQLIPPAIAGKDLLGQAKTGTGKTAAFGLPLMQVVTPGEPTQALVLAPTRELAIQIRDGLHQLAEHTDLRITPIYGGQSIRTQAQRLEKGPEIIVGTPGRVMDMAQRGYLRFDRFKYVVLDEVDRMLDIGFREDIRKILRQCPKDRQTIMVSATISDEIEDLARRFMRDPEKIVTSSGSLTVKLVEQHYLTVQAWDKKRLLVHLLTHEEPALTLVFCRLKRHVDELAEHLERKGIKAVAIHGDLRQTQRDQVMKKLRSGRLGVVVASDLAARGLDVEGISHVINYDLPEDAEVYVHRIGRTARAGRGGVAWSFVTPQQGKLLTQIEDLINFAIPAMDYPDFEASERPEGWKDVAPGGRPVIEIESVPARSRFTTEAPRIPDEKKQDERIKQKIESKFPGGIVPTKMPSKRMGGKVRTARSNKLDDL